MKRKTAIGRSFHILNGFTLVELAVVLAIVGLMLGSLMYLVSAQLEQRNFEETRSRLEVARELLLSYAIVNGRLPCPARSNSAGDEVRNAAGECKNAGGVEDYYGGVNGGITGGLLPARAIGFAQTDSEGFAVDVWGNRIRYAVARTVAGCSGSSTLPHFTNATNLKTNGITCRPGDLLICKSATDPGFSSTSCGAAANSVTNQNLVVAIVFSAGKNFTTAGSFGLDEAANQNVDPVFVFHAPTPSSTAGGAFDDYLVWIPVGEFYGRLISAGVLP